jgi:hypothetical protein
MAEYKWRENPACVATYRILEGDNFLDQFEDSDVPFADAGVLEMSNLRYFPKTTANSNIVEMLAINMARRFLTLVTKTFTVEKENPQTSSQEILEALVAVFNDGKKTVRELAEAIDGQVRFPNES